jgi:hypothetical protein
MLDISNRHDARDEDFTFDAPASGSLSHYPPRLLSFDSIGAMILAVSFAVGIAWTAQLAMWTVQLTKWAWALF